MLWQDAPRRANDIREKARIFLDHDLKRTNRLLLKVAADVERGKTNNPKNLFTKMLLTYGEEFAHNDRDYAQLFMFVSGVLLNSIADLNQGFGDKLIELHPLIQKMNKSATVLEEIAKIFLRARPLSKKERYYVTCVLYALDAEGPFDQACRLLYFLCKSSHRQPVSLSKVKKMALRDLRNDIGRVTKGESNIAFLGWNNRHLRNAIAHVGLEYNAANNSMRFSDFKHSQTVAWPEFYKYYYLTRGVSSVFLHVMLLLRARDVAFATKPFDP